MENERYIAENTQIRYEDGYVCFIYKSIDGEYFKSSRIFNDLVDFEKVKWEFAENVFSQLKISLLLKEIYIAICNCESKNQQKPDSVVLNIDDSKSLEYRFSTSFMSEYLTKRTVFGLKIIRSDDIKEGTFKVC